MVRNELFAPLFVHYPLKKLREWENKRGKYKFGRVKVSDATTTIRSFDKSYYLFPHQATVYPNPSREQRIDKISSSITLIAGLSSLILVIVFVIVTLVYRRFYSG